MTWSREMSRLLKMSISIFLHHFLITSKCFILMQTPLQLDIWLQSYEEFVNAKTIKNKGIWPLFMPISQKQYLRHPTHSSWSCHMLLVETMLVHFLQQCKIKSKHKNERGGGWKTQKKKKKMLTLRAWESRETEYREVKAISGNPCNIAGHSHKKMSYMACGRRREGLAQHAERKC